ncbi:MAG TPA: hypothetical protein PKD00_06900 [Burkholderiales bacterium]|nr:hypothetical protein [Burkholderiales bacterium]
MNKYLLYLLLSIGLLTSIYSIGYYKGKNNQKYKLLEANYKQLQINYIKQAKSELKTLSIIKNYHDELTTKNITINKLKEQLAHEKQYINATNHITTDWLYFVNRAAIPEVSIPKSTRGINEDSTEVEATSVANSIIDNYDICNENALQLEKLQSWIKEQEKIYNEQ